MENAIGEFLAAIFEPSDIIEFRIHHPERDGATSRWCTASNWRSQLAWLKSQNTAGAHIYVGVNPRTKLNVRGDKNCSLARTLFVDFDHGASRQDAIGRIQAAGIPNPSVLIESGHGIHAYWLLTEPCTNWDTWRSKQCDLIEILQTDRVIKNPERIMRLPGFTNHKPPSAMSTLLHADPSMRYAMSEFPSPTPAPVPANTKPELPPIHDKMSDLVPDAEFWLNHYVQQACIGERNENGFKLACQLRDSDVPFEHAEMVMGRFQQTVPQGDQPYTLREAHASCAQAYKRPQREPAESRTALPPIATTPPPKPQIATPADDFPMDLLNVGGVLGDTAAWMNESAHHPQPILSLAASIALWGTIFGRKIQSVTGLRSNVYIVGVGPSSCGKEHGQHQIRNLLNAAGLDEQILGGEDFTSGASIEAMIQESPVRMMLMDEFGHIVKGLKSHMASLTSQQIMPVLMKLFDRANNVYHGKRYAQGSPIVVRYPHVCLYGVTTPRTYYNSLNSADLSDGSLARFNIFDLPPSQYDPVQRDITPELPPNELIEHVRKWWNRRDLPMEPGNLSNMQIPMLVTELDAATKIKLAYRAKWKAHQIEGRINGTDGLWGKTEVQASKFAIIAAASKNFQKPEVGEATMEWACRLVDYLTERFAKLAEASIGDSEIEVATRKMLAFIKERGSVSHAEFSRNFWRLEKRIRKSIIETLVESEKIALVTRSPNGHKGLFLEAK